MQFSIQNIQSESTGDFLTQLQSCFHQVNIISGNNQTSQRIVKITIFAGCLDNSDYRQMRKILIETLSQARKLNAPVALVSQPPVDNKIRMEIWLLDQFPATTSFTFRQENQSSMLLIDGPELTCLCSTHHLSTHESFKENTREAFRLFDAALLETGFDYPDIVRQWNYIENITHVEDSNDNPLQNYQIFNDLRSIYYGNSDFKNGYPSATGIGTDCGGCTIEAIAIKEKRRNSIRPVTNSFQTDAHTYSSNVLIGNAIEEIKQVSTPKFERGKSLKLDDAGFLFVSGTAAIIGEQTVFPDDVAKQTLTTLQNIDHLVSSWHPDQNGKEATSPLRPVSYRVYLKNESDSAIVKTLCDQHWGSEAGFIVKADICRDNLLVEIEANYRV